MPGLRSTLPPEQLLAEVDELLRTMPTAHALHNEDVSEWLGRAQAVMAAWDAVQAVPFDHAAQNVKSGNWSMASAALDAIPRLLNRARFDLRLHTADAGTKVLPKGQQFNYFDEVRKVIERARSDLLFVDPYLGADFVARYLPYVVDGTRVRLLGREKMGQLVPAVEMMGVQRPALQIDVRSASGFHDRWIFLDGQECFQSGASFHDGARLAPTTLTPAIDAFAATKAIYEQLWAGGTVK
jgi:hypothetical protein